LNPASLTYTHAVAGWPAWLLMSGDDGTIKGVADTVGTSVITIIGTDAFGLTC